MMQSTIAWCQHGVDDCSSTTLVTNVKTVKSSSCTCASEIRQARKVKPAVERRQNYGSFLSKFIMMIALALGLGVMENAPAASGLAQSSFPTEAAIRQKLVKNKKAVVKRIFDVEDHWDNIDDFSPLAFYDYDIDSDYGYSYDGFQAFPAASAALVPGGFQLH